MLANTLRSSAGFTYLAALMIVMIMGIMLAAAGQSWKTIMDREREEEFLFRGMQYKDAIARWYKQPGATGQRQRPALNDLKDLLLDPNMPSKVRYLRTLYPDPLTGEDWVPIKGGATGGIIGVHSSSEQEPIKKANFPEGLEFLEGKEKYSEWQFLYEETATATAAGTVTPRTATTGTATQGTTR
ncbi:MAG TPA: type II secretion system protein [Geobacteraceae bacterium]|jgi:type II secretory pathway pseudopilin PulG|nr:type II secretion system protein [Geobacteraceae bacterium]